MNEGNSGPVLNQKTQNFNVSYDEDYQGYSESWAPDGAIMNRRCQVKWADTTQFVRDMIGYPTLTGGVLTRVPPNYHPWYPNAWCVACDYNKNLGTYSAAPAGGQIQYDYLVYDCRYQGLPYQVLTDAGAFSAAQKINVAYQANGGPLANATVVATEMMRYTERQRNFQAGAQQLPSTAGKIWQFAGAPNVQADTGGAKLLYTGEITYTWHQVPKIPADNISACIGKTNPFRFDIGADFAPNGFEIQSLLFEGASQRLSPSNPRAAVRNGQWYWDIEYKFLYRQDGWNKFFYPYDPVSTTNGGAASGAPGFYPVVAISDSATLPYPTADFTTLWNLGGLA